MIVDGNTAVLVEVRRMLNYRDPPPLLPSDVWDSPHDEKKDNEPGSLAAAVASAVAS